MELERILSAFKFDGKFRTFERFGNGHINDTYRLSFDRPEGRVDRYIVQRINTDVFKNPGALMENVFMVTDFLRNKLQKLGEDAERGTLRYKKTKDGALYFKDETGACWRCYTYIENVIGLDLPRNPNDFYQSAIAFGRFQYLLGDFPAAKLNETIPDFHNTADRLEKLKAAAEADALGRAESVRAEIEFALKRRDDAAAVGEMLESGELPLRVTELTALVRADDALLDREAERLLLPAPEPLFSDPCVLRRVRLAPLREAPEPLQRRALRCLLREALPQDAALVHIRALQALLENPAPAARADLPGRLTVRRSYDALELVRGTPPVFRPVPLAQTVHFPALGLRAVCTLAEKNEKIQNTPFTFALKYDKMVGRIPIFRPRKTGDMLTLPDGRCVTLKKLFLDRRLPQPVRDRVPVLELDGQVIAVAGFGADPRWTARDGEQAVILRIEKEEM